jgi:hypothetical protein
MTVKLSDVKIGQLVILGDGRPYTRISRYRFSDGLHIYQILNIYNIKGKI